MNLFVIRVLLKGALCTLSVMWAVRARWRACAVQCSRIKTSRKRASVSRKKRARGRQEDMQRRLRGLRKRRSSEGSPYKQKQGFANLSHDVHQRVNPLSTMTIGTVPNSYFQKDL